MSHSRENIFNLFEPQSFDCYVERYHSNLHVLRIRAERIGPPLQDVENEIEIIFADTLYYEGAFSWTGANFCIAAPEECLQTLEKAGMMGSDSPEEIEETLETYHLFCVKTTTGGTIKIVAHFKDYTMTPIA